MIYLIVENSLEQQENSDRKVPVNQKPAKHLKKFAQAVRRGDSLQGAMLKAGYSPATAKRGKAALSKPMLAALASESAKLAELGKLLSPEHQENLVRGRLALNTIQGKDNGVQSAKLLGSDKRVSMWRDDALTGVIVLQVPASLASDISSLPVLEAEWIDPPNHSESGKNGTT